MTVKKVSNLSDVNVCTCSAIHRQHGDWWGHSNHDSNYTVMIIWL